MPNKTSNMKILATAVVVAVVAMVGYYVWNTPDTRNAGEKMRDSISALPDVDKAAEQLESRTPGEKLEDAAKDASTDVKKAINQQ
jgi:hypothetical protein